MKPANQLVIFVKAPRLGTVKSRLAATIGQPAALAAYRKMVERLLENLGGLEAVEIRFSPDDAEAEVSAWLGDAFVFAQQGAGDLGEKLQRAFKENFTSGARRVVVIGSDCPEVTKDDIEKAWGFLASHDVVLGPAVDGGYWLIGLRAEQTALFENMPWSTEKVLETTLAKIDLGKLSFQKMRELSDIDTETEWNDFLNRDTVKI